MYNGVRFSLTFTAKNSGSHGGVYEDDSILE
jgi:hypothetical protein